MKEQLKANLILVLTLIGIIGGIIVGFVGRLYEPSAGAIELIGFPGEMLLRLLKMLILPLIISSLITGILDIHLKIIRMEIDECFFCFARSCTVRSKI